LAAYKLPRKVLFLDHLPRTKNGKLLRRELPHGIAQATATASDDRRPNLDDL
jgi:acyl-coenzyme A synthetase/AMP-(fatty) acid ligase